MLVTDLKYKFIFSDKMKLVIISYCRNMAMPHASKLKYTQVFNSNDRHKRGHLTGNGQNTMP